MLWPRCDGVAKRNPAGGDAGHRGDHPAVFQAGIAAGYLLSLEQIQFMLEWGFYVYNNSTENDTYYHRVGCIWMASDHLIVNLSLRTVWARARNVELGLGWRF